ncbi:TraR/DksA family transcriptional regulator [Kribbella sp. NPDC048928]|uniref:TraR/DksA family transcriptional regulator n=1 Tax=Kribbella sp. NPDC048928 TaxID=3364111 RepID=UPI00371C3B0C
MATKRLAPRRELSPLQLATLRAALLEQRSFRRQQLVTLHRPPAQAALDAEVDAEVHVEVRDHLATAARAVLADVEAALDRMHTGHYGQCRACRRPIALSRLRICPQCLYCAECHRLQETDR